MNLRDAWFFTAGIAFLAMAKVKHTLSGYATPKPFDMSDTDRCIAYDEHVIEDWLQEMHSYRPEGAALSGRNVLELGPGSDLGIGLLLLAKGAKQYNACDVNDLAKSTPPSFYDKLFTRLQALDAGTHTAFLREQLDKLRAGQPSLLNYVVQHDFDLPAAVGAGTIDLVFSQAAFEHFDDVEAVVAQLSAVCRPGAVLIAEIDLKTHSRWIRDQDPNNIYRYPDFIYDAFWFRGIPNRVRPHEYQRAFERHGWTGIRIRSRVRLEAPHGSLTGLHRRFAGAINAMECLSFMLCATRGP
ncbi:MAG: class I SAM-dependent methyltransferase [Steroidobacteraceae bacterium]